MDTGSFLFSSIHKYIYICVCVCASVCVFVYIIHLVAKAGVGSVMDVINLYSP